MIKWKNIGARIARFTIKVLVLIGAAVSFIFCIVKIRNDQAASAAVAAGLSLALGLLGFFDLDVFEAFGIKATLKRTLSEAEIRLVQLNQVLLILARAAFLESSRGHRTDEERQALVQELTDSFSGLGIDVGEIDKAKADVYRAIAGRLWWVYSAIRSAYLSRHIRRMELQIASLPIDERQELSLKRAELARSGYAEPFRGQKYSDLRRILKLNAELQLVATQQHQIVLLDLANYLANALDECVASGNYSDETLHILAEAQSYDSAFSRLWLTRLGVPDPT